MSETTVEGGRATGFWIVAGLAALGVLLFALTIGSAVLGSFVLGTGESGAATPAAQFDGHRHAETGTYSVTHDAGDAVAAGRLVLVVDGEERGSWAELSAEPVETVSAGERVTIEDVESGDSVRVVYRHGSQSVTLFTGVA